MIAIVEALWSERGREREMQKAAAAKAEAKEAKEGAKEARSNTSRITRRSNREMFHDPLSKVGKEGL